jgi:hypothetical protein
MLHTVLIRNAVLALLASGALCSALLAVASCSKKQEEPVSRPEAYESHPLPQDAGARDDARTLRQWKTKLTQESCDAAAKHANLIFGRAETDPKGAILLSRCLSAGNLAWYDCVMAAKEPKEISACSRKYFEHPPQ